VTVRVRCLPAGTIVLRQTVGPDSTHVQVDGARLANGRWTGEHRVEIGVDDTHDTSLDLRVRGGELHHEFDVPYVAEDGALDITTGTRRDEERCFASYGEQRPFVIMGSANASVLARLSDSGFLARTQIDCRGRSAWDLSLGAEFGRAGVGAGRGAVCRKYLWRGRWDFGMEPRPTSRPDGLTFVGSVGDRTPVRVSYHASSPATRPSAD
jgi:hypothetical protein